METSDEAKRAIEAIVMVADEPTDPRMLAQLIEIPASRVDEICSELAADRSRHRSDLRGRLRSR